MMRLTFDWDGVSFKMPSFKRDYPSYRKIFPNITFITAFGKWSRIHAIISPPNAQTPTPLEMESEDALNYRKEMVSFGLEDEWRLKGDIVRVNRGLPTSQLWEWKDGKQAESG